MFKSSCEHALRVNDVGSCCSTRSRQYSTQANDLLLYRVCCCVPTLTKLLRIVGTYNCEDTVCSEDTAKQEATHKCEDTFSGIRVGLRRRVTSFRRTCVSGSTRFGTMMMYSECAVVFDVRQLV